MVGVKGVRTCWCDKISVSYCIINSDVDVEMSRASDGRGKCFFGRGTACSGSIGPCAPHLCGCATFIRSSTLMTAHQTETCATSSVDDKRDRYRSIENIKRWPSRDLHASPSLSCTSSPSLPEDRNILMCTLADSKLPPHFPSERPDTGHRLVSQVHHQLGSM